jgi:hypothetical protein
MSIYGQDLMPIHPANIALMNPTPMGSAYSASGNTSEKKPQQPQTRAFKASNILAFCNVISPKPQLPQVLMFHCTCTLKSIWDLV